MNQTEVESGLKEALGENVALSHNWEVPDMYPECWDMHVAGTGFLGFGVKSLGDIYVERDDDNHEVIEKLDVWLDDTDLVADLMTKLKSFKAKFGLIKSIGVRQRG